MSGISYAPRPRVTYLFIDAGCLRAAVESISERMLGDRFAAKLNMAALLGEHTKAFYYDAVPAQGHAEDQHVWLDRIAPQMDAINAIRSANGFHAQVGDLRGKKVRQKKVDVQIAVDMLLHTVRQNMERCTLLAGDVDFQPLIEALIREGMYVTLWHPPHAAADLTHSADSRQVLDAAGLKHVLLTPDGYPLIPDASFASRPWNKGPALFEWKHEGMPLEVARIGTSWIVERLSSRDPDVADRVIHPTLRVALGAADLYWNAPAPPEAMAVEAQQLD
ncbi:NYN domain-containing protein [Sphingomonas sp. NY01]|uniref:NYN domain-containing protein n=1 Tax=Sphingomonas sp. NY01 TaxID=2968057 RepID=UPI00315D2F17